MSELVIQNEIDNNASAFTIEYAKKILERARIFINSKDANTDLEKYVLLKMMASDICFSCELLLKSKINNYNNGDDFSSWKTHNLLAVFNKLDYNDKVKIFLSLGLVESEIDRILQDEATSDAFIKRYLYEGDTGIPDYEFLCKFANALLDLNGVKESYDLSNIDVLHNSFNYNQFDFEDIIKEHTKQLTEKASIYDLSSIQDDKENYIVRNMKSCDYALFCELRYKYFDREQNPRKDHEFSSLHKRLEDACKFLVSKGMYMDRYINKDSTANFRWALESLMFNENFSVGDPIKDIYRDINETFEKSRYCTIEYYDKYYSARDFFVNTKCITDLLIMNKEDANTILDNKNKLIELFGIGFLSEHSFTVDEMRIIDIEYLKALSDIQDIYFYPKSIILETNKLIRKKVLFFANNYPRVNVPVNIDYVVDETSDGLVLNKNKYSAHIVLQSHIVDVTKENIDRYISLLSYFNNEQLAVNLSSLDMNQHDIIDRYFEILNICRKLSSNNELINSFIVIFGPRIISSNQSEKTVKYFLIYKYARSEKIDNQFYQIMDILYDYPFDRIVNLVTILKKYNLINMFGDKFLNLINMSPSEIEDLIKFSKEINISIEYIDLDMYLSGKMKNTYQLLKSRNLGVLFQSSSFANNVETGKLLDAIIDKDIVKNISNYDETDINGIRDAITLAFEDDRFNLILQIMDLKLIIDNPKVLLSIASNGLDLNENYYRLNLYNTWYQKVENNEISCNGSKLNLNADQIESIKTTLVDSIMDFRTSFDVDLSSRLEQVFSNGQLVYSMNKDILCNHDIDEMNSIVDKSKFKSKDFDLYNYFANLFDFIKTNELDSNKVLDLINSLYRYKNSEYIQGFIMSLCSCKREYFGKSYTIVDNNGEKEIDNETIDYLYGRIQSLDMKELFDYLSNIDFKLYKKEMLIVDDFYSKTTTDEKKEYGRNKLKEIKHAFKNGINNFFFTNKIRVLIMNAMYNIVYSEVEHEKRKR